MGRDFAMQIKKMILEGEGLQLDFKKTVPGYEKIARTLAAFANTRGGRLLIGVNDTGDVSGIRSEEEEKFALTMAGSDYCSPPIVPYFQEVEIEGRLVLVADIPESDAKPHFALDDEGKWWAYIRVKDRSILASSVTVEVMKKERSKENILLEFTDREKRIMDHLHDQGPVTFREYCRLAALNRKKATRALVKLILLGLVKIKTTEKEEYFSIVSAG